MGRASGNEAVYGLGDAVEQLEALIGREHVAEEYVRFRIDLLKSQWHVRDALEQALNRKTGNGREKNGPVTADAVDFDFEQLKTLCGAMRDILSGPGSRRGRDGQAGGCGGRGGGITR